MIVAKLGIQVEGLEPGEHDNWGVLKFAAAPNVGDHVQAIRGDDSGTFVVTKLVHYPAATSAELLILAKRVSD